MDYGLVHDLAYRVRNLPLDYFPVFDLCHIILCVLAVRKEAGKDFARRSPFSALLACLLSSFAGSLICNPLLGKPILAAFSDEKLLVYATIVFLVVFFSPADVGFSLLHYSPVYFAICVLKEILRAKKIASGLKEGSTFKSDGSPFFVPIIVATIKGNGSGFLTPVTRLIRGVWQPFENEVLKPSLTTKLCLFTALIFTILGQANDFIYLSVVGLLVLVKVSALLGEPVDPFKPVERIFFSALSVISDGKFHAHKE